MRRFKLFLALVATLLVTLVAAVSASAYLHLANAQSYAVQHTWTTFCNSSSYWCWRYPFADGWYQRINDSYVRVEIQVGKRGYSKLCYRVFAVKGSDAAPYISTDGSWPYWNCPV